MLVACTVQAGSNPKCRICRHRIHNRGHDGEVCAPSVPVFVPTRSFLARGFAAISWVPAAPLGQLQTWGHHLPQGGGDPLSFLFLPLESLSSPRRCYNCGGLDHHAKECKLPPQPKKCHFCQSISHMVANCPAKAQQSPSSQGKPAYFREEEDMHSSPLLPETRE